MNTKIRAKAFPNCIMCGSDGDSLYDNVKDYLFAVPGAWSFRRCPNVNCGHIWLDPMPLEDDIINAYNTYQTHQFESTSLGASFLRRVYERIKRGYLSRHYGYYPDKVTQWEKMLSLILEPLPGRRADIDFGILYQPFQPGKKLLDVGCGNGRTIRLMRNLGWETEGVDFDANAVRAAAAQGLHVRLGSLAEQEYPDDHFNVVSMSHVIEHIHDPYAIIKECYRILKPGGRLVIITPNNRSYGHNTFKVAWRGLEPPRHTQIYSLDSMRLLIEQFPFRTFILKTTIRNARGIYLASNAIMEAMKTAQNQAQISNPTIQAELWQMKEWALHKKNPQIGEELVLIATK